MINFVEDMERMLELMEDYVDEYKGTPIESEIIAWQLNYLSTNT